MAGEALPCISIKGIVLMRPSVRNRWCPGNPAIGEKTQKGPSSVMH